MKIIKLQARVKQPNKLSKSKTETKGNTIAVLKAVCNIIRNKDSENKNSTALLMGGVLSFVFNGLALISLLLAIFVVAVCVRFAYISSWTFALLANNIIILALLSCILIVALVMSLVFRAVANDMNKENDRNYIVNVFSSVVSFAALIVALVALLKGVG